MIFIQDVAGNNKSVVSQCRGYVTVEDYMWWEFTQTC